jgi:hypothetical protein
MSDEQYERVAGKLQDALDRERVLRQAVEWYADPKNWARGSVPGSDPATEDRGGGARAALKNA